ncbi:MAG: hypothetical protein FK734_09885, partial [Asgard group archaeon]|nr:hypothetical protein [Asgard group archaeon]
MGRDKKRFFSFLMIILLLIGNYYQLVLPSNSINNIEDNTFNTNNIGAPSYRYYDIKIDGSKVYLWDYYDIDVYDISDLDNIRHNYTIINYNSQYYDLGINSVIIYNLTHNRFYNYALYDGHFNSNYSYLVYKENLF